MKPRAILVVAGLAFSMVDAGASVVSIDIGHSVTSGGFKSVDFDGDGTPELFFRGNGAICTDDEPTSTCVYAVSIAATPDFEFLLRGDAFDSPQPLVDGDVLGDGSFIGVWGSKPFDTVNISAADHFLEPDRLSYPEYLDEIEILSIGFRQRGEDGEFRYGWVDVRLRTYLLDFDGETIQGDFPWPTVLAAHYSDGFDEPVSFIAVPEPSAAFMLLLGAAITSKRTRRR